MSLPFASWIAADVAHWVWNEDAPVFASDQTATPPVTMNLWGGDFWGYIPPSAKTTQSVWGQQNRPGFGVPSMIGPRVQDGPTAGGTTTGMNVPGLPNDMLQSMVGYPVANSMLPDVTKWNETTSLQSNTFARISKPSDNNFLGDTTQCSPWNFPKCSMVPMKNSSAKVYMPNTLNVNSPPNCWFNNTDGNCTVQGTEVDLFAEYMASLDDLWQHYSTNGTEYLSEVNAHDTSSWDPCKDAGGQVDDALQATFGVLFAVGLRVVQFIFVPESAEMIDMPGNIALTVGPVAAGWFFAKHSLNKDATSAKEDLSRCASCLLYTVSFIGGGFLGKLAESNLIAIAAGGGGGYLLDSALNSTIVTFFEGGTIVPTYLLKFMAWLFGKIVKGKCVLDYADTLMCLSPENADSDIQFKQVHSRRWDVASIAALLTDEALVDMNVTDANRRASKQAEYVWKGLMYGVAIMTIGSNGVNGGSTNVFQNGSANPLGEITPIVYGGAVAGSSWGNFWNSDKAMSPWGQVYQPMGLGSWEGNSVNNAGTHFDWLFNWLKGDPNLTSACNLYGCNNWKVIRNNTYGAQQSAMTAHISETLAAYKLALTSSYSDANYELMRQIPGTPSGDGWKSTTLTGEFKQTGLSAPFKPFDKTAGFDPLAYALSVAMQHGDPTLLSILETNPNAITAQSNLQRICENDNPNKNVPCISPSPQRWYTFAGAFHRYMLMKAKFPTPLLMLDNMDDEPGELMKAWIVQAWNVSIPNAPQFTSKYQAFLASEPNKTRLATYLNNPQAPPFVPEYST